MWMRCFARSSEAVAFSLEALSRVDANGAAPRGAECTPVTSALARAPRGAVRGQILCTSRRRADAVTLLLGSEGIHKEELWQRRPV